jgi:hypothetical protein
MKTNGQILMTARARKFSPRPRVVVARVAAARVLAGRQ